MSEDRQSWSDIQKEIAEKMVEDPNFRAAFMLEPEKKLAEHLGMEKWPENIKLVIHENIPRELHISIPSEELSDVALENIAGGGGVFSGMTTDYNKGEQIGGGVEAGDIEVGGDTRTLNIDIS